MPFPDVINLKFDPIADSKTAAVFADDLARTFYLCWRSGHLVSEHFVDRCIPIAEKIRRTNPKTILALSRCARADPCELLLADLDRFWPEFLPYVLGEKQIGYRVAKAARGAEGGK